MIPVPDGGPLRANVLLIDDDPRVLTAMQARLEEMGCECTLCSNACEAMMRYTSGNIDLVITDLMMPGIDGLSVIGLIRNTSDVPVIVVTGHGYEYGTVIGQYRNVTVLQKPFHARTLKKCVHSLLVDAAKPEPFPRVA